jgi:hypothetical protein
MTFDSEEALVAELHRLNPGRTDIMVRHLGETMVIEYKGRPPVLPPIEEKKRGHLRVIRGGTA